ncbi:sugar phosphate isomerase/epimerase family protein [Brevibacillus choshinensis]|uniref:Sugar phosphate isomerase/epimerase n=1 Tax=Brevibacillus choshinensis TaxID=54911 RepID=A0ABX7FK05_BRECH|nr:sugar phosphate isomerase/epimerase [Brevibacillus choshinensis]QRG65335.1 sugar phosphate isomerase/epimerase [Brevibacillus choshinensis]
MHLGVFTVLFSQKTIEDMLDHVAAHGLEAVELGTGGYPGSSHCPLDELLESEPDRKRLLHAIHSRGLRISALSCHGNPLHPQKAIAQEAHTLLENTMKLAELLEVPVVNTFSGCPGDSEQARYPNWPVAPWPHDFQELLDWQWNEKIYPYWTAIGQEAKSRHIKIGLELHGGFSVHTPGTLLRLRERAGDAIGANLDPSHLWWQGIDPVQAIRILGRESAIHHFHAKDTSMDKSNLSMHGVTDMQPYSKLLDRAWQFRTVGYGHDLKTWADIMSTLRLVGYDYVVSIEHEDGLMSIEEGFSKAVQNLKQILIREPLTEMWWV